jgi:hypothetical protein
VGPAGEVIRLFKMFYRKEVAPSVGDLLFLWLLFGALMDAAVNCLKSTIFAAKIIDKHA